jgi:hypothetical protein
LFTSWSTPLNPQLTPPPLLLLDDDSFAFVSGAELAVDVVVDCCSSLSTGCGAKSELSLGLVSDAAEAAEGSFALVD